MRAQARLECSLIERTFNPEYIGIQSVNGCSGQGHEVIGGQVGIQFQIGNKCGQGWTGSLCMTLTELQS